MGAHNNEYMESEMLAEIADVISNMTGVQFSRKNEAMLRSRILRRAREVGCESIEDYHQHWRKNSLAENEVLVSLLTTHHTYFFREYAHFEYLEKNIDSILAQLKTEGRSSLRVWCAACSFGHEPYSFAIFLHDLLRKKNSSVKLEFFGSDIDKEVLKIAGNGVYRYTDGARVPAHYLDNYFNRGTGEISSYMRIHRSIREVCNFKVINLMNPGEYPQNGKFDVIICRNVFIYFSPEQVETVSRNLSEKLIEGGTFIIGLSEHLNEKSVGLKNVGKSVFRKSGKDYPATVTPRASAAMPAPTRVAVAPPVEEAMRPLRVLCVDDSKTILSILKQILTKEAGFEIVGVALNGREAAEQVAKLKPDVMTLDIHMPEMTGIEYLERHYSSVRVPCVMLSSVASDDKSFALRALELGASDYVEKPTLQNLGNVAEEIRVKLKMAFNFKAESKTFALRKDFAKTYRVEKPETKARVWLMRGARYQVLKNLVRPDAAGVPSVVFLVDGDDVITSLKEKLWTGTTEFTPGTTSFVPKAKWPEAFVKLRGKESHLIVTTDLDEKSWASLRPESFPLRVVEEFENYSSPSYSRILKAAQVIVPATSFVYESERRFAGDKA